MYRVLTLRLILLLTFSFNPLSKKREASLLPRCDSFISAEQSVAASAVS